MEIRDSEMSLVFLILYICKMKKNMKEKNQVVPDEVLSKEFISQFKTEADVSRFAKNGADCYSKNGDAVTVLTWQS